MLTTHIRKQVNIFGFSKFYKFLFDLVMQFFMDFLDFANFLFCFMQGYESDKDRV